MRKHTILKNEAAIDYLSRAVSWLTLEGCALDLPSPEACLELFDLYSGPYDTSSVQEMRELIECEGEDATPYNNFVKKWKLSWCRYIKGEWQ